MSETATNRYELTPDALRGRLEGLTLDFLACTRPSILYEGASSIALQAKTGERVIIEKSVEGAQSAGAFFQDLIMSIHPGSNPNFGIQQLDFNFNEHGDNGLRRRVISGKDNGVEEIPKGASDEGIVHLAKLTLHNALEFAENIKLEEQMGVNNQPATPDQIAEAMGYLDGATVLNQEYQPVAVLD